MCVQWWRGADWKGGVPGKGNSLIRGLIQQVVKLLHRLRCRMPACGGEGEAAGQNIVERQLPLVVGAPEGL